MTFADAILKLRSERRMSQTQLAKELGVSYTSVNRWENGRSLPTKMMILVIRRYCEEHHWNSLVKRLAACRKRNDPQIQTLRWCGMSSTVKSRTCV